MLMRSTKDMNEVVLSRYKRVVKNFKEQRWLLRNIGNTMKNAPKFFKKTMGLGGKAKNMTVNV